MSINQLRSLERAVLVIRLRAYWEPIAGSVMLETRSRNVEENGIRMNEGEIVARSAGFPSKSDDGNDGQTCQVHESSERVR